MGELKIQIDHAVETRLADAGKNAGKSPEELVQIAIAEVLGEFDDLSTAQRRFEKIDWGAKPTISHGELIRKLGLAD